MATDDVLTELKDGVLYLTLNRPAKLNALSTELRAALVGVLEDAAANRDARCVVLTGAGRGFCSGGDILGMEMSASGGGGEPAPTFEDTVANLRHDEQASCLLHSMPKVTIAAVNGPAAGAGLCLALAADLRIAAESARFGTAFARVGFAGDYGGTWTLTRLVGPAKARELYFLPDIIDAKEAHRIGLVNRVCSTESFRDEVHAIAKRIANGPTVAYRHMKANLNAALTCDFADLLDREAMGQILAARSEDHREARRAFLEKRAPVFKGR